MPRPRRRALQCFPTRFGETRAQLEARLKADGWWEEAKPIRETARRHAMKSPALLAVEDAEERGLRAAEIAWNAVIENFKPLIGKKRGPRPEEPPAPAPHSQSSTMSEELDLDRQRRQRMLDLVNRTRETRVPILVVIEWVMENLDHGPVACNMETCPGPAAYKILEMATGSPIAQREFIEKYIARRLKSEAAAEDDPVQDRLNATQVDKIDALLRQYAEERRRKSGVEEVVAGEGAPRQDGSGPT